MIVVLELNVDNDTSVAATSAARVIRVIRDNRTPEMTNCIRVGMDDAAAQVLEYLDEEAGIGVLEGGE